MLRHDELDNSKISRIALMLISNLGGSGDGTGVTQHSQLSGRSASGQHPMSAITGLVDALAGKQPVGSYLTSESDPSVPAWAKQPTKPTYTADEVGALPDDTVIPAEVTETTVSNWGFTKNSGTYSKPDGGIPKSDLSDSVKSSLAKADNALPTSEITHETWTFTLDDDSEVTKEVLIWGGT